MLYTPEQIKDVLWNTFTLYADNIEMTGHVGDEYWFNITLNPDIDMDKLHKIGMDLHDSGIFDVVNNGNGKLIVKYTGESDVMDLQEMRELNEAVSDKEYVEFNDGQISYYKKAYGNLSAKVAGSNFMKSVYDQLMKNKKLTKKQFKQFKFVIDNGDSMYNKGKLTTKN